jgi:NAD(P)-dependent dehydrogenase (short-subunit alcohol dehydrogenase family)
MACATLAELGAAVAAVDARGGQCTDVARSLSHDFGVAAVGIEADVADDAAVSGAVEQARAALGGIDVVVAAAALVGTAEELPGWSVPFAEQSPATWRRALEVNLTSVFVLAQSCLPALVQSGHGSIITVSSIYGLVGPDLGLYEGTDLGNPAAYAAGKGGLVQLTRWLATVVAPGVRVNAISPGGIERGQPEPFRRRYRERTPLGRMGTEEDLRGAIAYLATDLSAYVTGHNLVVDGGWTAW